MALARLAEEDPTFQMNTDPDSGQTIIRGMGELHLEVIVDRMLREFKVSANIGKPQVAYKETITKPVRDQGRFVRQSGGKGQYGHVWLEIEPLERGSGFVFEDKVVGGAVPREYISAVESGVREAMESGGESGNPIVDLKVALVDGSYHEVDSSEMAFNIAGSMALKEGVRRGKPVILEPYHEGRSPNSRGFHGGRNRRPVGSARPYRRHGDAGQHAGGARVRAAREHVRLCDRSSVHVAGSRDLFNGVRSLRAGSREPGHRNEGQGTTRLVDPGGDMPPGELSGG